MTHEAAKRSIGSVACRESVASSRVRRSWRQRVETSRASPAVLNPYEFEELLALP
jgi:hypothetical protein